MSSTALKIIAAITVVLALLLAAVSYRVFRQYAETAEQAKVQTAKAAAQTLAVVAVRPLAAYKTIERDAVALVPVTVAPKDYYSNLDAVIGKTPLMDIDAGAPLSNRYFTEGNALTRVIPVGFQALSLEINDVIAVGGFVRPGDLVDVLVYLRGGAGVQEPQARVLLSEVRVLAYEERIIDRPKGIKEEEGGGSEDKRRRVRTAVLAVPESDTTRVMLGASLGELRLALHGQLPAEVADGATGLPLSAEAQAKAAAGKTPDKAITAGELVRGKPKAGGPAAPDKRKVIIYRGTTVQAQMVSD